MNTYNEYYKRHRTSTLAQLNNSSYGKFSFIYSTDFPLFFNEEGDKSSNIQFTLVSRALLSSDEYQDHLLFPLMIRSLDGASDLSRLEY